MLIEGIDFFLPMKQGNRFLSPNVKFTNGCFQIRLFLDTLGSDWEGRLFPKINNPQNRWQILK